MTNNNIVGIAVTSFKTFMINLLKLAAIVFSWGLQFLGQVLNAIASTLQKIIIKKSS